MAGPEARRYGGRKIFPRLKLMSLSETAKKPPKSAINFHRRPPAKRQFPNKQYQFSVHRLGRRLGKIKT
jgi:hypothetical protein